jgi:hypothetical protein
MKCKVKLYIAGKIFYEEVEANNYKDAKQIAVARNPTAQVMGVTGL